MQRTACLVLALVILACGSKSTSEPNEPRDPHDVGMPAPATSGSRQIGAHVAAVAARLEPCRDTSEARWPSRACRHAIRALVAGCGTADLRALAATDRVTEPCKQALWKLLPARDSHRSRVLVLGTERTPAGLDVYVATSDADGEPAPALLDALALQLEVGGRLEIAARAPAQPLPARCEVPLFAASSILDYSGSMSDRDVAESIALFRTLYAALPAGCLETEVIVFSDDVRPRGAFTAEPAAMQRLVDFDPRMVRGATALVDALGDGASHVARRRAPIRLALVATDGHENASARWTYARALRTARDGDVRIVSFGSLLSDVGFLERLGAETGGFFLYRAHAQLLADAAHGVGRLLASTRRIRVTDARLAAATHLVIGDGPHAVRVPLR